MKIAVVFHLPEQLLYCNLTDLTLTPAKGSGYVFGTSLYEVVRPTEILSRRADGTRLSLNLQLMQLLVALSPLHPQKALYMLANMRNVGDVDADAASKSAGGVILHRPLNILNDAERIVVLEMRLLSHLPEIDEATLLRGGMSAPAADSGD